MTLGNPYRRRIPAAAAILLLLVGLAPASCASDLALVHARVYIAPNEPPVDDETILVHNGRIQAVGKALRLPRFARSVTVLDCQGLVVTAGFWNSHVHILMQKLMHSESVTPEQLSSEMEKMFTRWGFTSVFDIASVLDNTLAIRRRIESGEVRGPHILTAGDPFYPKGGTPIYVKRFLEENHVPSAEVESAPQAVERERAQFGKGADGVKIFAASFAGGGKIIDMPLDIATAIVREAHEHAKPVFAHPSNADGLEIALKSGVDILAHTAPLAGAWSPEFAGRLKAAKIALVPTLTLFDVEAKKFGETPQEAATDIATAVGQLKSYYDAGGQILFGTDIGYIDQYDTSEEFTLMSRAGMSFQAILASLTTSPAQRFASASTSGRITKGYAADLVVLNGDPAGDVTAFSKVKYVVRNGRLIYSGSNHNE